MDYSKDDILPSVYIYIIYPSNYKVDDISTRQFYIGSTENYDECKKMFYEELYRGNTSKKIILMREYMTLCGTIPKKDKEENADDKKFWQITPIFIGINCCTKHLLKALEGLYIYYYYSVLNDEEVDFKPNNITDEQLEYFKYLDICNHLSKCYTPFEYKDLIYDVNPYTLINKDPKLKLNLKHFMHIYKEICDRISIPRFKSIFNLTFQYIKQGKKYTEDDFAYKIIPDNLYMCIYCKKIYKFYNNHLHTHLIEKHNDKYNLEFKMFIAKKTVIKEITND